MGALDDTVIDVLADRVLKDERLREKLVKIVQKRADDSSQIEKRRQALREEKEQIDRQLNNLWKQVSLSNMKLDGSMKAFAENLQTRRNKLSAALMRIEEAPDNSPTASGAALHQIRQRITP